MLNLPPAVARATLIGSLAPVLWGLSVPLVRLVGQSFGGLFGPALMTALAVPILLLIFGPPRLSRFPRRYLYCGISLAVLTELCFFSAIISADGPTQTAEVGMVNYLWPCLTLLCAVLFNGQRARPWIVAGFACSVFGIFLVLAGPAGVDWGGMLARVGQNPACYGLALAGAVSWACYSSVTRAWSKGCNGVVLIFALNACLLSALSLVISPPDLSSTPLSGFALAALAAAVLGLGYGLWTLGSARGDLAVLALISNFTPVLSALFCALLLRAELSLSFALGTGLIVAGSLICHLACLAARKVR